jgi:hypothetical protein
MHRIEAAKFAIVLSTLEAITRSEDIGPISGAQLDKILSLWEEVTWNLRDLECEFSVQYAEQVLGDFRSSMGTHEDLRNTVKVLQGRFEDELRRTFLYRIERKKAILYETSNLFGEAVLQRFPSTTFDIEEAGKCLASDRNTACVMHLMRVVEIGLRAIAMFLGIDPKNASWGNLIRQIDERLKQNQSPRMSQSMRHFLSGALPHLNGVRIAWRDRVMHVDKMYDEQRAQDIFNNVSSLMRYLAEHLDENGELST